MHNGECVTIIMDGKVFREELIEKEFIPRVQNIKEEYDETPKLVTILVGDDPASQVYVRNKITLAKRIGLEGEQITLPKEITFEELTSIIKDQNNEKSVSGILLQLPLPDHLQQHERKAINLIHPLKDVDGLTNQNQGALITGDKGIIPCTPLGIIRLLKRYNVEIEGKRATIIGRSILVGKPIGILLLKENATVTYTHSRTRDLKAVTRESDILVVATGRPEFITKEYVKEGAVVVDIGINRNSKGRLVGDVAFNDVKEVASYITPVPGGIGPMTVAMLMNNTIEAFLLQHERRGTS